MKKFISVLLCFTLLFSFSASAATVATPQLKVSSYGNICADLDMTGHYLGFAISLKNCPDFESFELLITYNPDVLEYSAYYPFPVNAIVNGCISCTVLEPGQLQVISRDAGYDQFDPFCLKAIGSGDTNITVELISWKNADGEIENGQFETAVADMSITNSDIMFLKFKKETVFYTGEDAKADPVQYIYFNTIMEHCPDFESFTMTITYNPEVLRWTLDIPVAADSVETNNLEVIVGDEAGVITLIGTNAGVGNNKFPLFGFEVIGNGYPNVKITPVEWKTDSGTVSNNKVFTRLAGQYVVTYESIKEYMITPTAVLEELSDDVWLIPANMTVAELMATAPQGCKILIPDGSEGLFYTEVIGTGCIYWLDCYNQYYMNKLLIVENDLSGDGKVTAGDARQALRFAVGLDTATEAQCHATGVSTTKNFTSDIARSILRCSIGLEP